MTTPASPPPSSSYPPSSYQDSLTTSHGDYAALTYDVLDEKAAIAHVSDDGAGATVLFSGTTRDHFQNKKVTRLEYEAYTSLALKTLSSLLDRSHTNEPFESIQLSSFEITRSYVVHRLGQVPVGQSSILIAVSSPHRKEAFVVAEWLLEEVKKNVALWKREFYQDGQHIVARDGDGSLPTQEQAWSWKTNFPPSS